MTGVPSWKVQPSLSFTVQTLLVLGLDGRSDAVEVGLVGLRVVLDEPGEERVDDLAALGLVGVPGDQRVLRLTDVDAERATARGGATLVATLLVTAATGGDQ